MKFLAIDIGASSGRHITGTLEEDRIKLKEVYRFANGAEMRSGHLVWDEKRLVNEVLLGLKAAGEQGLVPDFVGIDTWAVDYALLDEDGNAVGDVFSYRDGRTEAATEQVHRIISFNELYSRTGIQFQPFNTVYQLYADKLSGRLERAKRFLMLPDYLGYRLTGKMKQEYTNATSTGMVNAVTHKWDGDIIGALGFEGSLFGELSQPGTAVGNFSKQVRDFVGYDAAVVLPATHDTASAVLAAPINFGDMYISSGTWSLLGTEQRSAHTGGDARRVNYSNEGSIDFTFRLQKNIMGLWMLQNIRRELGCTFPEMISMARTQEKGCTVDVNDARFLAPADMLREIRSAAGKPLSDAQAVRAVYDSLALSYKNAVEELEGITGVCAKSISIIGGGSRDGLLNELTARATGKRVLTGPVEATSIGNIVMQMISAGEIQDIAAARKIIKNSFDIGEAEA